MTNVAAQVAAWQRRARNRPGPLGPVTAGSGDSPSGSPEVELLVSGTWVDITSFVMTRDGSQNVAITRGQQDEATRANPMRVQFQLNNRDGRFSPNNPLSPLYGLIARNQQLRVSVPNGNVKAYRFWGEVTGWPQSWDTTGTDVWVPMDASGVLRRLGQGSRGIGSAMYVSLAAAVPNNTVIAYWPFEDLAGATSIGSAVSGVPGMAITGSPTLATNGDFVCSLSLPTMQTGKFVANIPDYTAKVPGTGGPANTLNTFNTLIRFLLEIPSAGITTGSVLVSWKWTGTVPNWEVYYSTAAGGQIGLRGRDTLGNIVQDTGVGGPAMNGTKVHVTASLDLAGGISFEFFLSILTVGSVSPTVVSGTAFGPIDGIVQTVRVAPNAGLGSTVIGHVSVQLTPTYPTDATDLANVVQAYAGELAATRIARLCALANIGFELVGSASDSIAMGTQLNGAVLDLIQQCVDADLGRLFEPVDMLGLGYRTRVDLENQSAALALNYAAFNLSEIPEPLPDDRYTRNDVTASRTGGSVGARQTQASGTLSTQSPPFGVGPYDETVTVNIQTDARLNDVAGWLLHLGTVDDPRYPKVSMNLAHASFASSTVLRGEVLTLRPGDRYTVANLPTWIGYDGLSQLLLSTTETIDLFQHRISLNGQPESPYRTARLADAVFGRIDTGGSQLAADVGPAATSFSVSTTSGPVWTTSGGDFPFDVRLGGEQVTVTNITGASSPQTFTVVRSVNGVVKVQSAGTDIRLNQPMILGL